MEPDLSYGSSCQVEAGPARARLRVSIFADRPYWRGSLRDDALAAGAEIGAIGPLSAFDSAFDSPLDSAFDPGPLPGLAAAREVPVARAALGDLVWIDCPRTDARSLAMLCALDLRAAAGSFALVVSTSVAALEEVFSCLDQSEPILLVEPGRADRAIALAQAMTRLSPGGVRELSEDDKLMLMRLTEEVGRIAGRIDRLAKVQPGGGDARSALFPGTERAKADPAGASPPLSERAAMPDPRMVRRIIRQRQMRARFFDADLFADPAWDMLLDLTAARAERTRVSVTSLCIAAGVPPTTALRWIGQMVGAGLFKRVCDDADRRRAFIELTDRSAEAMARYFHAAGFGVPAPV